MVIDVSIFSFYILSQTIPGLVSTLAGEFCFGQAKQYLTPRKKYTLIFDREKNAILNLNSRVESY